VPEQRLDSWKSIASYLDRSLRTVQRWHAHHGLPVRRFGGEKSSVFAYANEIDRWLINLGDATLGGEGSSEARQSEASSSILARLHNGTDGRPGNARAFIGLADTIIVAALQGEMDRAVAFPCAMEALRRAADSIEGMAREDR
jgi:hypothetical protein